MVMERVATSPPDEPDVGVFVSLAVIVELPAWVFHHIGHSGHGDEFGDRIVALRKGRIVDWRAVQSGVVHRRIAEPKARPRQADLPQHRRKCDGRPKRLFAVILTCQSPSG